MRTPTLLDNVIGLTHTGRSIARNVAKLTVVCGGLEVAREELVGRRPGRARQMRRMIARSNRRFSVMVRAGAPTPATPETTAS